MMEEHKSRFLKDMLRRIERNGVKEEDLLEEVSTLEDLARGYYWSRFNYDSEDFVKLLVTDGCFVIELLRKYGEQNRVDGAEPLLTISPIRAPLFRDLFLVENQVPFKILEKLYNRIYTSSGTDLRSMMVRVFRIIAWPLKFECNPENLGNLDPRHLLDLARLSLIPDKLKEAHERQYELTSIPAIRNLLRSGIRFRHDKESKSPIEVEFQRGELILPTLVLDDFTLPLFRNFVIFEQCGRYSSMHMTAYVFLLTDLITSEEDLEYLCKNGIIVNYFGSNAKVVKIIQDMLAGVSYNISSSYLSPLYKDVDRHCRSRLHIQIAGFKYAYFRTPWSFISSLVAAALLLLPITSTTFTILKFLLR